MYTGIKKINGLNAQKVTTVFAGFDLKTNTLSNTSDETMGQSSKATKLTTRYKKRR